MFWSAYDTNVISGNDYEGNGTEVIMRGDRPLPLSCLPSLSGACKFFLVFPSLLFWIYTHIMYHCRHISLYILHLICVQIIYYICFKMANIPSFCDIISKHMYPIVLPKIAPFCMKISKNFLGEDPRPPLITIVLDTIMLWIHIKKSKEIQSCSCSISIYVHAHTGSLKKKITVLMLKINNPSRQNLPAPPPPESNGRPLTSPPATALLPFPPRLFIARLQLKSRSSSAPQNTYQWRSSAPKSGRGGGAQTFFPKSKKKKKVRLG